MRVRKRTSTNTHRQFSRNISNHPASAKWISQGGNPPAKTTNTAGPPKAASASQSHTAPTWLRATRPPQCLVKATWRIVTRGSEHVPVAECWFWQAQTEPCSAPHWASALHSRWLQMPLNGDQLVNVFLPWLQADKTICVMVTFDGKWFCLIHFWLSKGRFLAGDKRVILSVYGNVSHRFACRLNAQSKSNWTFLRQNKGPHWCSHMKCIGCLVHLLVAFCHNIPWLQRALISSFLETFQPGRELVLICVSSSLTSHGILQCLPWGTDTSSPISCRWEISFFNFCIR